MAECSRQGGGDPGKGEQLRAKGADLRSFNPGDQHHDSAHQKQEGAIEEGIPQAGADGEADALFPGFPQPLAQVDQHHRRQDRQAEGFALAEGKDDREQHEETELAEDVGRRRRDCRHAHSIPSERQAKSEPQKEEAADEERDALTPEGTFESGQGRFCLSVNFFRMLVEVEVGVALL